MSSRQIAKTIFFAAFAAVPAMGFVAGPAAAAVPAYVNAACKNDYFKFCPSYEVNTTELRQCMRSMEKRLSQRCIDALEKSGEQRRRK